MASLRVGKLRREHEIAEFDCGREALNRFLLRYALQNQQAGASQTYVALAEGQVVGYYTRVAGQVDWNEASQRLTEGLATIRPPSCCWLTWQLRRIGKASGWEPDF